MKFSLPHVTDDILSGEVQSDCVFYPAIVKFITLFFLRKIFILPF